MCAGLGRLAGLLGIVRLSIISAATASALPVDGEMKAAGAAASIRVTAGEWVRLPVELRLMVDPAEPLAFTAAAATVAGECARC